MTSKHMARALLSLLAWVVLVFAGVPAFAQPGGGPPGGGPPGGGPPGSGSGPIEGDPHGGHTDWTTPSPEEQINRDPTLIDAAGGAIFVPAMTDGEKEPFYIVRKDGKEIATARPGTKIPVPPGEYEVLVGSGDPEQKLAFDVTVVEGRITIIPAEWGGLVIAVLDERGTPIRGTYELITLPERQYVGLGLGAILAEGEQLTTWVIPPGLYMLLSSGESYQARRNFATLRVLPGKLMRYTVVLDENTGDLLGAGEVSLLPDTASGWDYNLVLGGSGEFNWAQDVVGQSDGQIITLNGFFESTVGYTSDDHLGYGRFNLEVGGRVKLPEGDERGRPFFATVNELALELLYAYRVTSWFGPYVRASVETQVVPGIQEFDDETDVRIRRGTNESFKLQVLDVKLTDPFSPVEFEIGSGPRLSYTAGHWLTLNTRVGLGLRQYLGLGLIVENDDAATAALDFEEVKNLIQFGIEGAVILRLNLGRWAQLQTTLSFLAPFLDPTVEAGFAPPLIDFQSDLALRLTSVFSINYRVRVIQDPQVLDATQINMSVLLRFAYRLL